MRAWQWLQELHDEWKLFDGRGRARATIWRNSAPHLEGRAAFVWSTWDENGTGGENCEDDTLNRAKDSVVAAIVRQGWSPGGWKVKW